ncbi:MAG: phenylalanine--tRNA ligase subunit beta [Blastocatellia bacterium]
MKISYNWLSEHVALSVKPQELADRLTMVGLAVDSIELAGDDHVLEFDLTSNRPDCLSHLGVAREAAIVCGTSLKRTDVSLEESGPAIESVTSVEVLAPDLCPRFTARVVRGVKVGSSPKWLVDRLEAIGQRSVNNIADITNYVMFEMGQPTHAFDLNLLHERRIVVRRPRAVETLKTLDGVTRELSTDHLVICDADHPVAIAGVMGGEETEINKRTTDVLIESAYFNPASIRQTARTLGLDTEASYRFARGADFNAQLHASARVAELVARLAGGRVLNGAIDVYPSRITREAILLREFRVERLTGLKVSIASAAEILRALEFEVELVAGEKQLRALPPSFRIDVRREEDLVEEVARHTGYDRVAITLPPWSGEGKYLPTERRRSSVRAALTGLGFDEAYAFSFVNGERDRLFRLSDRPTATLANPIDSNQTQMRASLITGLLEAVQHNFNQGCRDLKLFEIGRVFEAEKEGARPDEREMLAVAIAGSAVRDDWRVARAADFYDLKGAIEAVCSAVNVSGFTIERASVEYLHPGQSAALSRKGEQFARFGRLHPQVASLYKFRQPVYVGEVEFQKLLALEADRVRYSALPRFPASSRDVSLLLPDAVMWGDIEKAVSDLSVSEIVSVQVFDTYKGKEMPDGFHSLAFRVTYRGEDRTLTDEEVATMHERVLGLMKERFGAELR